MEKRGFWADDDNRALVLTLVFFSVWVVYGLISSELYSDDDMSHFMIARYAPRHPELFLDIWGRPLFTLLYSPGAQFGLLGGRITSAIIGAAVLYLGYIYARNRGYKRPYLFIVILGFMTRFWGTCYNMDTGLTLCLVLAGALALWSKDKHVFAAMVISLAPAARPEGILFVPIFAGALVLEKKWKAVPFVIAGLFLWDFIPFVIYGDPLWLLHHQPWKTTYGRGEFLHYFKKLTEITGPVQLPFFLAGIVYSLYSWRVKDRGFLAFGWLAYFFFLVFAWWQGAFSTVGLTRYFNGITPLTALIALDGINWLLDRERGLLDLASFVLVLSAAVLLGISKAADYPYFLLSVSLALVVRVFVLGQINPPRSPLPEGGKAGFGPYYPRAAQYALVTGFVAVSLAGVYPPFKVPDLKPEHQVMFDSARWYRANIGEAYSLCSNTWFNYFAGIDPYDESKGIKVTRENLEKAPRGSLVVWDARYAGGERYGDIPIDDLLGDRSYRLIFSTEDAGWGAFLFEKI